LITTQIDIVLIIFLLITSYLNFNLKFKFFNWTTCSSKVWLSISISLIRKRDWNIVFSTINEGRNRNPQNYRRSNRLVKGSYPNHNIINSSSILLIKPSWTTWKASLKTSTRRLWRWICSIARIMYLGSKLIFLTVISSSWARWLTVIWQISSFSWKERSERIAKSI